MKKVLILIILTAILIIALTGWLIWKEYQARKAGTSVSTYLEEYQIGENPKIKIENSLSNPICFSSCYPYRLEKNDGGFKSYDYSPCSKEDVAEICLEPGKQKAFELVLDKLKLDTGIYRVALPACVGCTFQEKFREDKRFYSNTFLIK